MQLRICLYTAEHDALYRYRSTLTARDDPSVCWTYGSALGGVDSELGFAERGEQEAVGVRLRVLTTPRPSVVRRRRPTHRTPRNPRSASSWRVRNPGKTCLHTHKRSPFLR